MLPSLIAALFNSPRTRCSARLPEGYATHPLTTEEAARLWRAALRHSGIPSVKEAADAMGYENHTAVSRWASGAEPVQFARVVSVPALRRGLLLALAESGDTGIRVETVVQIQVPA